METWLKDAYDQIAAMPEKVLQIREAAENDLFFYAKLVNPGYMYGSIHREIFRWMQDYSLYGSNNHISKNKLIMLPRAHLKSHMVMVWASWMIVRHPEITILYVSATAELAQIQLFALKNLMDTDTFRRYWPEYINPDVGKREKWSASKIIIDHPQRKKEGIRDATIATAGLTTNTTGWHADVVCSDDIVVPENAYTEEGRESVSKKTSQFTSIRNAGGFTIAAGTRYHPLDIYGTWYEQVTVDYDDNGVELGKSNVWDVKEYAVETEDRFIWPRMVREDNKVFGFDLRVLARIKAEYTDTTQFYAQYYNDPNDPESSRMGNELFQYYNPRFLKKESGKWYYNGNKINVYAAVDFAFSMSARADYTAIVVIGMDSDQNIYVLDIDRFKSFKAIEYFQHISALHSKWGFKKLQAEVNVAQKTVVDSIKDYVKNDGLRLSVVEFRPGKVEGRKEDRIAAVLEHRYEDRKMWHLEGGWTAILEDELVKARPSHDDIKDALASAVSIAVAPARGISKTVMELLTAKKPKSRFGGAF